MIEVYDNVGTGDGVWSFAPNAEASLVALQSGVEDPNKVVAVEAQGYSTGILAAHTLTYKPGDDPAALARSVAEKTAELGPGTTVTVAAPAAMQASLVKALQEAAVKTTILLSPQAISPVFSTELVKQGGAISSSLATSGVDTSDSVALQSDLELGGTDQKFNLLVGRELQREYGKEPQCVLTMPLLEGLDGVEKMSKSKGNYVGITEPANTMFAKVMSISDAMMWRYFTLLSFRPMSEIDALRAECEAGRNPKEAKVLLARENEEGEVGERIRDAMRLYVRRVIRQIGSLIAMMNGIDMLVFTAGVGENSAEIRRRILEGMTYFGIKVDQEANKANAPVISTPDSAVKVVIQPTNEEWIAARHAVQLLLGKEQQ